MEQNNDLIQSSKQYRSVNADAKYGTHWHIRITGISETHLKIINTICAKETESGKISYAKGGTERGDDGSLHLHLALGYHKSITKWVLYKLLRIKAGTDLDSNCKQWYIAPIYKDSTPEANAAYATKTNVSIEYGNVPTSTANEEATEAKKSAASARWKEMITLAKAQKWEELEEKFPYQYIIQGAKLRALYFVQHTPETEREHSQHLWIFGEPGTGKSAVVEYLFPNHFKKRPDNDWLGYNPLLQKGHRVVYLPDFDMQSMKTMKAENLKVMCDPQGFNANKKFAGGDMIAPGRVVVTSNFTIQQCFPPGTLQIETQIAALRRRFKQVHINTFLKENGLILKPKAELEALKKNNNFDYSKCFDQIETTVLPTTQESTTTIPPNEDDAQDQEDLDNFIMEHPEIEEEFLINHYNKYKRRGVDTIGNSKRFKN
jgi:hypothetical protein